MLSYYIRVNELNRITDHELLWSKKYKIRTTKHGQAKIRMNKNSENFWTKYRGVNHYFS